MRLIDITRELTAAPVYPGDPAPELKALSRMALGDVCNLSLLTACVHNGTHMDAPLHFIPDAADTASVDLNSCIGECCVVEFDGVLLGAKAEEMLPRLRPRVLFKGKTEISESAAFVLSTADIRLVGVESPSVAPPECSIQVHRQMLGAGLVLLESLDLSRVQPGYYFLFSAPLKIAGSDGSPVRAVLVER